MSASVIESGQSSKIKMNKLAIALLVRRFGRCGGMESYVWHLADKLADLSTTVYVICDQLVEGNPKVKICIVGRSKKSRNHERLSAFGIQANEVVQKLRGEIPDIIVHAHERSVNHDVITAHGTLFDPRVNGFKSRWSKRVRAWLRMQRNDFVKAQTIIPVSDLISEQIQDYYAQEFSLKLSAPGLPAIEPIKAQFDKPRIAEKELLKIVFVGKEWKRKGLDVAISICSGLKLMGIPLTLDIFGPLPSSLPAKYLAIEWITPHSWTDRIPYEKFDLLMLLSKDDPFGMVVVEALQHGVPCILSKGVGAGRHLKEGIITFNGKFDTSFLTDFISIINSRLPPQTWWSWKDLARWHITEIYTPLLKVHDAHQRKIEI